MLKAKSIRLFYGILDFYRRERRYMRFRGALLILCEISAFFILRADKKYCFIHLNKYT